MYNMISIINTGRSMLKNVQTSFEQRMFKINRQIGRQIDRQTDRQIETGERERETLWEILNIK